MKQLKIQVCSKCGSENVMADAWAQWSVEDQRWERGFASRSRSPTRSRQNTRPAA